MLEFQNTRELTKIAIVSKTMVPDVALIDPQTTVTMDSYLTACTGIDAMAHAIEAFVSTASGPLMDSHAIEAIRLVFDNLLPAIREPDNLDYRGNMMLACLKAGLAFSNASLGAVHAMAHSLGGYRNLAHGECNAMLLPHVAAFNYDRQPERYEVIAGIFGVQLKGMPTNDRRKALVNALIRFTGDAGIRSSLGNRGIVVADIGQLAGKAMIDPCMVTNPRRPEQRDIEVVYEEAL